MQRVHSENMFSSGASRKKTILFHSLETVLPSEARAPYAPVLYSTNNSLPPSGGVSLMCGYMQHL